ncbi:50S ribosomal protein L18 [bacterium]|nr:50S ribosomal protein L18 [bacterium]
MAKANRKRRSLNPGGRARLSVFKSNTNIYAQIIDDRQGSTLAAASSIKLAEGSGVSAAVKVGQSIAEIALEKQISEVWFDRGRYKFTGRVKALADAAREKGLKF